MVQSVLLCPRMFTFDGCSAPVTASPSCVTLSFADPPFHETDGEQEPPDDHVQCVPAAWEGSFFSRPQVTPLRSMTPLFERVLLSQLEKFKMNIHRFTMTMPATFNPEICSVVRQTAFT